MANINSNVITLKTVKQVLTSSSDSWVGQVRTFNINVRNENDLILAIKAVTLGTTAIRYLSVKGKNAISDEGILIEGMNGNGEIYGAQKYSLNSDDQEIRFDVRLYNYVTVEIQLNANQSIQSSVYSGTFSQKVRVTRNTAVGSKNIKIKVKGSFFRLRARNTYAYTSRIDISGANRLGEVITKTLFSPADRSYLSTAQYSTGQSSDSFVRVDDIEYLILNVTAGNFLYDWSFFDIVEREYTDFPTTNLGGAVRGFEYVSITASANANYRFKDSDSKLTEIFNVNKQYVGVYNASLKQGKSYYLNVKRFDTAQNIGGGYSNMQPVFGLSVPEFIETHNANGVTLKRLNSTPPDAQFGKWKAYKNLERGTIEITEVGAGFNDCEYSTPISSLVATGTIQTMVFLTYNRSEFSRADSVRLVIQFTDGSIFHNFPNRSTTGQGTVQAGDAARFDKSVIWDFDNRFPSTDPNAVAPYYYDPTLSADNYDTLVPLNEANAYGNGGFPISRNNRTRYRKVDYVQALRPLNGFEIDKIYSACDTYYSNTKNGYLETSDGGREWFLQAPMGAGTPKEKTYGVINTSAVPAFTGSVKLFKRISNMPSSADKDPAIKFTLTEIGTVTAIASGLNPAITVNAHGLSESDKVFFTGTSESHGFMLNNTHNAISNGNGQVYFVSKVIDANTINIEPVSAYTNTNIECRHVHSLNRVHDGWIMACGEEYPYGWLIFIKQHLRDFMVIGNSWTKRNGIRVTSAETSVQRAVGFLILDDSNTDPTCLWAVDTSNIDMPMLKVDGRDIFRRGSNGLRVGKFSDLDDYSKFTTIVEFDDAMLGLKKWNDTIYAVGGYSGQFAVSVDSGKTFTRFYWGESKMPAVIGSDENGKMLLAGGYVIGS